MRSHDQGIRTKVGRTLGKKEGKERDKRKKKPPLRQNLWRFGARAPRLARVVVVFSSDSETRRGRETTAAVATKKRAPNYERKKMGVEPDAW